ncbi:YggS family pyridoxal phosphate-dependent enzyme [Sutcliffiella halmapala]|uniref:YggS family pyridoxal phosphate-dependent enzyme n=1 Tax=Sutcliffiella halmapala TaxID=79882 RepID=UPI000994EA6E|nr:YggS family pyridoxal phosphate-dependent enzyme [Sutcliffiella halmapala]
MSNAFSVKANLEEIKENIRIACLHKNRNPENVKIVAVTKYVSVERTEEAFASGITDFGENRDEGLLEKFEILSKNASWHFIGSLQTRKVKKIIDKVDYIHSLDRVSLAEEIHKRATKKVKCFIQLNVSGEESKHGIAPHDVADFVKELAPFTNIEIVGLMTMAPYTEDEDTLRKCFRELKNLQECIQTMQLPFAPCTELSMGMSNDYMIAIEEGATFIRIGSALVGNEH